ncbi:hypothetical protein EVAR_27359_1 [Eumeta japonica]|uniref:Uncharacterized protein n=1 Tax=Eumeta variegata TaxID=151549 RepID=A0A4C1UDX6_EUMVA|nr:hypothetical protein EVAR_27359_1 [Eumeta japonica]
MAWYAVGRSFAYRASTTSSFQSRNWSKKVAMSSMNIAYKHGNRQLLCVRSLLSVERLLDVEKDSNGAAPPVVLGGHVVQNTRQLERCRMSASKSKLILSMCQALQHDALKQLVDVRQQLNRTLA